MITIRPGSHARDLLIMLSVTGEFPVCALKLLGSERVMKALVHNMTQVQEYRLPDTKTNQRWRGKLLKLTNNKAGRGIRLTKAALPILDWVHPGALDYYLSSFWNHKFPGDLAHIERNYRVAEAAAMFFRAGIQMQAYELPVLQNQKIDLTVPGYPAYYLAKDIKKIGASEMNKTMFTRITGALFSPGGVYAVYNTRNAVMKWNGMGEFKALHDLLEISRMNAGGFDIQSAILFGVSHEIALRTLQETEKNRRLEFRFDNIYQHIYFVPMDAFGIKLLQLFVIPEWKEKLNELLFDEDALAHDKSIMEYDAFINHTYVYSFLDYNIARLIRLREALQTGMKSYEILCYPEQIDLINQFLGPGVCMKTVQLDVVLHAMIQSKEE